MITDKDMVPMLGVALIVFAVLTVMGVCASNYHLAQYRGLRDSLATAVRTPVNAWHYRHIAADPDSVYWNFRDGIIKVQVIRNEEDENLEDSGE